MTGAGTGAAGLIAAGVVDWVRVDVDAGAMAGADAMARADAMADAGAVAKPDATDMANAEAIAPTCRPHDLLRLARLALADEAPAWAHVAMARTPFVVVRRAVAADGHVAVGVRGETRAQRYGCVVALADVAERVSPEALLGAPGLHGVPTAGYRAVGSTASARATSSLMDALTSEARRELPVFRALTGLLTGFESGSRSGGSASALLHPFTWGPAGSVGFELATSVDTVTPTSDLDLLIRTPSPLSREDALSLTTALRRHGDAFGVRIDAQLETPVGGIALAEWAAGGPRVLVRSAAGPRLVANPWSQ